MITSTLYYTQQKNEVVVLIYGWVAGAVNHALSAADYDQAATLISQISRVMLKRGEATTLMRWLSKLPQDVVQSDPHLRMASAWTRLLTGPFAGFETVLEATEQAVANLPAEVATDRHALLAEVQAIRTIVSVERGDTSPPVVQLAQQAFDDLPGDSHYLSGALSTSFGRRGPYRSGQAAL